MLLQFTTVATSSLHVIYEVAVFGLFWRYYILWLLSHLFNVVAPVLVRIDPISLLNLYYSVFCVTHTMTAIHSDPALAL